MRIGTSLEYGAFSESFNLEVQFFILVVSPRGLYAAGFHVLNIDPYASCLSCTHIKKGAE